MLLPTTDMLAQQVVHLPSEDDITQPVEKRDMMKEKHQQPHKTLYYTKATYKGLGVTHRNM